MAARSHKRPAGGPAEAVHDQIGDSHETRPRESRIVRLRSLRDVKRQLMCPVVQLPP